MGHWISNCGVKTGKETVLSGTATHGDMQGGSHSEKEIMEEKVMWSGFCHSQHSDMIVSLFLSPFSFFISHTQNTWHTSCCLHHLSFSTLHTYIESSSHTSIHAHLLPSSHTFVTGTYKKANLDWVTDDWCDMCQLLLSQCCHIYFPSIDLLHCADTEQKYEQVWHG